MRDNGFEETELGPLPTEWDVVQLGDVATLIMGQSPPSSTYNLIGDGLPFLQGKAEFGDTFPTPIKWCSQPQRKASSGSVLVSVRAPVGDANVAKGQYCIGRGLASINGNELLDNWYLFFQLIHAKKRLEVKGTGTTFQSINKGVLQEFTIPLPPLPEQCAIAHVLSTVRQSIEATERVIVAARELKHSLMKYLFTYGPVPIDQADQVVLKETEIGEVAEHWQLVEISSVANLRGGKRLPKGHSFSTLPTPYPYIRVVDMGNWSVNLSNLKYLTSADRERIKRYLITRDDVYISIAGTIGLVGVIPEELDGANLTENAARIVINNNRQVDKNYLTAYLASKKGQKQIEIRTTKTSQPKLALTRILQIPLALPPTSEQLDIARSLAIVDAKILAEIQRRAALEALFNSLLHHLMTGKVRIEYSGRTPNLLSENIAERENDGLLNRLIMLEEDVRYQEPASKEQAEFEYTPGSIPILLSAPHGAVHIRIGHTKEEDEFTAGFARLVAELTGAHVIYLRRKSETDPNWYSDIPYKTKLERIIKDNDVRFVLDIHGACQDRKFGIALGTKCSESCPQQRKMIIEILNAHGFQENTEDRYSILDIDQTFTGTGIQNQQTIVDFVHSIQVPAAQFELNAVIRIPARRLDATANDKTFRGNPLRIKHTIEVFVSLVQALS